MKVEGMRWAPWVRTLKHEIRAGDQVAVSEQRPTTPSIKVSVSEAQRPCARSQTPRQVSGRTRQAFEPCGTTRSVCSGVSRRVPCSWFAVDVGDKIVAVVSYQMSLAWMQSALRQRPACGVWFMIVCVRLSTGWCRHSSIRRPRLA